MKILLVEDHKFLAEASIGVLREMYDHDVEHALTAAQALRLAEKQIFDVILIDLNLPDANGYDLARQLRANKALNRTVFIALTGIGNSFDEKRAESSGIDASFTKPMDFAVLSSICRRTN